MNCGLYKEALMHLDAVSTHEWKDWRKVLPTIYEAKFHIGAHEKSIWYGTKLKKGIQLYQLSLSSSAKKNLEKKKI